jgi:SAM-dependent methyltransferase
LYAALCQLCTGAAFFSKGLDWPMKKTFGKHVWDAMGIPLRMVLLPDDWSSKVGFTSLEEERISAVLPHIRGKLLDIGAGRNTLVNRYDDGIGVDVHDWGGGALIVKDPADLPFADGEFDTVTFVACLNHIPNRAEVLEEAWRVLNPGGQLIITMISPILGEIGHRIWWYGEDKKRDTSPGEVDGLWAKDVVRMCERAGFTIMAHKRFLYGLNNLYLGLKQSEVF